MFRVASLKGFSAFCSKSPHDNELIIVSLPVISFNLWRNRVASVYSSCSTSTGEMRYYTCNRAVCVMHGRVGSSRARYTFSHRDYDMY